MKKKLFIVMYDMEIGGAEKSLLAIINSIDYERYEVDLFLHKHQGELLKQLPKQVHLLEEIPLYTTFCMPLKQVFKKGFYLLAFARLAAHFLSRLTGKQSSFDQYCNLLSYKYLPSIEGEYDAAISNIWPYDFIVYKVKAKVKIGWIHNDYINMRMNKKIESRLLSKLDYIVTVSEKCKELFDSIQPMYVKKSIVIQNMVSKELLHRLKEEKIQETDLFERPSIKIVTVARLHWQKGVDIAVHACKRLIEEGFCINWFIIGFGLEEEKLRKEIKELNIERYFYLLGKKENPYPYIKSADIYVQPSRTEGKAISITEAKMLGKTIITTNYNTAGDQIINEYNGLIVNIDANDLADGIKRAVLDSNMSLTFQENLSKGDWGNESELNKLYRIIETINYFEGEK